jgi:PKD repeat protein
MVDTLKSIIVSSNGCESDAVVNYIRVTYPRPNKPIINNSFTQSGVDYISGCSDQTMDLQIKFANTNYNYNWYDAGLGGNLITQNSVYTTPKLTNVNSYEYWVETNDNYCISERKKVKITVIQTPVKPKVTILGSKICRGDDAVLVAEKDKNTNPIAYYVTKWYDSKNVLLQTGDTLKIKGIKANETIYCTTIDSIPFDFTTKLGPYVCESQATSTSILVDTVATPVVAYTTPSCVGSNIQFNVLNTNINGSVKWFSNSGKLLSTSPTYKIMNIQKNDTVICQAFGINGCTSYKSISIVNVEKPTAAFTSNKTKIEAGDIVLFDNQSINAASYFWDFGDNSTSTQKSPFHYYNNPGTFTVKLGVKAQNGCTDTIVLKDYIYVSDPNGIEELTILNKISAFPIPFSDQLQIELPSELNSVKVTMVNEVGQTIFSKIINSKEIIGTNQISPGFYFLRFEINGSIKIIKLAKL